MAEVYKLLITETQRVILERVLSSFPQDHAPALLGRHGADDFMLLLGMILQMPYEHFACARGMVDPVHDFSDMGSVRDCARLL